VGVAVVDVEENTFEIVSTAIIKQRHYHYYLSSGIYAREATI
jgi:hypothetical protein